MKTLLIAVSALLLTATAKSQSADDIVAKHITAMGGANAYSKVKTARFTGTVSIQGMDLPLENDFITDRAVRTYVEIAAMDAQVITALKDGKGWKKNQFAGAAEPTALEQAEIDDLTDQTSLSDNLFDSKKTGATVALVGEETVNGAKAYKIKLTSKKGVATTYLVDASSYFIVKSVSEKDMGGQMMEVETSYSDYKAVEGVQIPHTITMSVAGNEAQAIKYDKIEINPVLDEKIFDMP